MPSAQKPLTHSSNREEKKPLLSNVVSQLFLRLRATWPLFGTSWKTNEMVKIAKSEWSHELAGLELEQIETGLRIAKEQYIDRPPNLIEFKKCCKAGRVGSSNNHSEYVALPAPEITPEQLTQHRKKLMDIVNKNRKPKTNKVAEKLPVKLLSSEEKDYRLMYLLHLLRDDYRFVRRLKVVRGYI